MEDLLLFEIIGIVTSLIAFGLAAYFYFWVKKLPGGDTKLESIGLMIKKGARAFLRREYKVLSLFVAGAAVLIFVLLPEPIWSTQSISKNLVMTISYIAGSVLSALAGKIGIEIATIANVKSAVAAKKGISQAFSAGFRGGAVMGMAVVGTSLLGSSVLLLFTNDANAVLSFSFGASTLALFAKAGGGIFTKTADISADLVGKVELGIDEDDPRNPAVIADNVGDNVGDVAGMGADLFDSHIAAIVASLVMAYGLINKIPNVIGMVLCYTSLGLLASVIGSMLSRMGKDGDPGKALNNGTYFTTGLFAVFTLIATFIWNFEWAIWISAMVGLLVGVVIGITTDYFTNDAKKPVRKVAHASQSGPAFTIISGFSYGLLSVLPALLGIAVSAFVAHTVCTIMIGPEAAMFGIGMAALGMLSIVGMIVSNDAYGPIVDNARGIAEMGGLGDDVIRITDELDSAGNTVKAITKGFSISAAGLTVIALLGAFQEIVEGLGHSISFDIMDPLVFFGLIVGLSIPAIFSAMLMLGVNKNAERMVSEIHRQFDEIPGLKEGKEGVVPEYEKCIDIATIGAIRELIPAGAVAILATLAVGFLGGIKALGGFLTGNIVSGLLLALIMSNSGGLWDNAKKYVESGNYGGKGSDTHKAAVIGDTVGDPFKDTAGPSINTQITVVSLVANLTALLFASVSLFS
ncbi:MAG: sodium-translocating pyrophosphatase [Christensenellales bacterium]